MRPFEKLDIHGEQIRKIVLSLIEQQMWKYLVPLFTIQIQI